MILGTWNINIYSLNYQLASWCAPCHGCPSNPLTVRIMSQYFAYIVFKPCMWTMPVCFMPHVHLVWKLQNGSKSLAKLGIWLAGQKLTCFDPLRKGFCDYFLYFLWQLLIQHTIPTPFTSQKIMFMKYFISNSPVQPLYTRCAWAGGTESQNVVVGKLIRWFTWKVTILLHIIPGWSSLQC